MALLVAFHMPRLHRIVHYTAISRKAMIVNSRYWKRKELWDSSNRNKFLSVPVSSIYYDNLF